MLNLSRASLVYTKEKSASVTMEFGVPQNIILKPTLSIDDGPTGFVVEDAKEVLQ